MKGSYKTKLDVKAYQRDNFQCRKCGKRTGLEAHHVIPELEKLSNLITLCHSCHKREHNMSGCFRNGFDPRRKISAKLTKSAVLRIRSLLKQGERPTDLAHTFGVSRRNISAIKTRYSWKNI